MSEKLFVVQCLQHGVMEEANDGLLYFGRFATVYRTRYQAHSAIQRTYKDRPTFDDDFGTLRIIRLKEKP